MKVNYLTKSSRNGRCMLKLPSLRTLTVQKQPAQARVVMLDEATPLLVEYHHAWDSYVLFRAI